MHEYFIQIVTDLLLSSTGSMKKWAIFDILMIITPGVNIIRQQNTYFIYYLSCVCWFISFLHFNIFKIQFNGVPPLPFALCSGL